MKFILLLLITALTLAVAKGSTTWEENIGCDLSPFQRTAELVVPRSPPKVDIMFSFDLTGSMGWIIDTAKNKAIDIMSQLQGDVDADFHFGVISYMDYPMDGPCPPTGVDNCGYYACYGSASAGDYPYRLDQMLTPETSSVSNAISGLVLGYGWNGAEAYTRVYFESYSDTNIGWRDGASRILVDFGDNVPHACNINEGVDDYYTYSTGRDPGRDEQLNTEDDLVLLDVLQGMADNGIKLLHAHSSFSWQTHWEYWTGITGGSFFLTNAADLPALVVQNVQNALIDQPVTGLHVESRDPLYTDWVQSAYLDEFVPDGAMPSYIDVTLVIPYGTPNGNYAFWLIAKDDNGVEYDPETLVQITILCSCEEAVSNPNVLWPPNHKFVSVSVEGLPAEGMTVMVTGVTQDEPLDDVGDGNTEPDAIIGDGGYLPVQLRAERTGTSDNGRVYRISFDATHDATGGACTGAVDVCVPHDVKDTCWDDGQNYDSTGSYRRRFLRHE